MIDQPLFHANAISDAYLALRLFGSLRTSHVMTESVSREVTQRDVPRCLCAAATSALGPRAAVNVLQNIVAQRYAVQFQVSTHKFDRLKRLHTLTTRAVKHISIVANQELKCN